jgi:pimeloyl-ACP methyl ester carboxylesterase
MDDIRAVVDAAWSHRAFLFGISEGGPLCCLFAATYPERAAGLVLYGTTSGFMYAEDHPWGYRQKQIERALEAYEKGWGTGISAKRFAPSCAVDEEFCRSWGRFERRSVSPGGIVKLLQMVLDSDVRHVLPSMRSGLSPRRKPYYR